MDNSDKSLTLLHLRKTFSSILKENGDVISQGDPKTFERILPLFNKVMHMYTPDELLVQFKEIVPFCGYLSDYLVHEIRRRANNESTKEAAAAIYDFLKANPPESKGWTVLKAVSFLVSSGSQKIFQQICKSCLPSTLVKVFYLFFDLDPSLDNSDTNQFLYDSLVMLMATLCGYECVAEELIHKDDLVLLFIGSSSTCPVELIKWRDANFTFLSTIILKSLSPAVTKYIRAKGCIGHYLRTYRNQKSTTEEKVVIMTNMIDLLRNSAESTNSMVEDFMKDGGFQMIVDLCDIAEIQQKKQIFDGLVNFTSAGSELVSLVQNPTPLSFYPFNLPYSETRSNGAVRIPDAFLVLEKCFYNGDDTTCDVILDLVLSIYKSEKLNYFILERHFPLYLFVERMVTKGLKIQKKVLFIVEYILRDLGFIPCKELTAINLHLKNALSENRWDACSLYLTFLFSILSINIHIKDAYRELLHLETILNALQSSASSIDSLQGEQKDTMQLALDFVIAATKGNAFNAQFITENLEINAIKSMLLAEKNEEFKNVTLVLIKNLLFLARNEQLFSSLLQILFSDPGNINVSMIILKLFVSALLESHKVRIMFRRSGGYICLMTLLLHLENALPFIPKDQKQEYADTISDEIQQLISHISLIFRVFTVSMRYEPSNAKYVQGEVKPGIVVSILRTIGCFNSEAKVQADEPTWNKIGLENISKQLRLCHEVFQLEDTNLKEKLPEFSKMPKSIFYAIYLLRRLFNLAMDAYERQNVDLVFAGKEWLNSVENLESIPVVTWSTSILSHPTIVLCILKLLPSIAARQESFGEGIDESDKLWSAVGQFYISLVLKALMRQERSQQILCEHLMPRMVMDVGAELFKKAVHPLLSPFHYMLERLACQSMHPKELRRFLRLDQPLCCLNLDDDDNDGNENSGGPVPIHRVKALVSMLTPRNHSLVHPPAFVEFDMAIEGFAALVIPSLAHVSSNAQSSAANNTSGHSGERLFPPMNGMTYLTWFYVDEWSSRAGEPIPPIRLLTVVRNFEGTDAGGVRGSRFETHNIENHLCCLYVQLLASDRSLLVSTVEHSMLDELRKDFQKPLTGDFCVKIPLSEQFFYVRQWTHLAIVMTRSFLKQSQIDIYVNGRCLASQKLNYVIPNAGGGQAQFGDSQSVHALVGTPPFLRKAANVRWRMASTFLIDEPLPIEKIRKIYEMQPHYIGSFQIMSEGTPLIQEEKISFSLNASAMTEVTMQSMKSMLRKSDCEMLAVLLGISSNDSSTPLRVLWNTTYHGLGAPRALGANVIGYLSMRTFSPRPVSALLESVGGVAPLLGLVAMCTDSHGLYASLKVLVSAVQTNDAIVASIHRQRGYQTLAMLLEEKSHLVNSHILHLVLSLVGTVDVSKEITVIPNMQTFEDLLCDLDVWTNAQDDVKKLLFEHFYELVIDNQRDNLAKVRNSSLLNRLLMLLFEQPSVFVIRNDILFRLIGAIVQPPCDSHSLLRFGQTLSANLSAQTPQEIHENDYPFHIAELEKLLLAQCNGSANPVINEELYSVYVRNRLLNMLGNMLAHSSGQINSQLCDAIVSTLGFGWILAMCAPGLHPGTVYLGLKILVNVTKHPSILSKFRDGACNGGWLTDADSVIRNRAAVLLGFSVSAHGGAVGSHVDFNPELSNCNGFAALEYLMYMHADQPFCYLAMLALLFGQHQANIQPLEEFNVDLIWSNVFSLNATSSVSDAIAKCTFCPEALIPLFSMIRAGLHHPQSDNVSPDHWSQSYPIMVLQLTTFLYQNSETFFGISHTSTFVITLFTTLLPRPNIGLYGESGKETSPSALPTHRAIKLVMELLTNILLNDLCLSHELRTECIFDMLVEFLEGGGVMHPSQSTIYTELVNSCLDHFMTSDMFFSNSALIIPKSAEGLLNRSSESTAVNVIHFLSKVIDSVWDCLYRGNPVAILKCFLKLLAEAHASNKAASQLACNESHINALFRVILYLLSRPVDNVDTQMSVLDTLAEIVRNQHLLLSKNSNNPLFYGALVHLVFMLSEKPDIQYTTPNSQHLERGSAQVAMCAQNVWGILWAQKKALLEEIFKREIDLDLYSARASCSEMANKYWLQFVDSQTDASSATTTSMSGKLPQQIQSKLSRVAKTSLQRLTSRTSVLLLSTGSITSNSIPPFHFERSKIEPETFYMWMRVHISLLKELLRNQCTRYHEWHAHVRKWCMQDWQNTEAELTRERGLWGPEQCSTLDKFELDTTEGPLRIRKKLIPNPKFYHKYPYRPHLDAPESKAMRSKVAISKDSKTYYERMKKRRFRTMDERIVDTSTVISAATHDDSLQQMFEPTAELNLSMIKRMVKKNVDQVKAVDSTRPRETEDDEAAAVDIDEIGDNKSETSSKSENTETQPASPSPSVQSSAPQTPAPQASPKVGAAASGNGPDNQTLLRLLEHGEQLHSMFRCARIQGLDTIEGLLLFGREHYYVVDGFTLLKTREIRDLDFLPEQFHDPIIPYMAMGSSNRPSTRATRQCSKFSYDDIKDVHKRRYLLQPIALEVFSGDGRNYLLAFPRKIRDRVYQKFISMAKGASSDVAKTIAEQRKLMPTETASTGALLINSLMGQQSMTQRWQRGEISNFNYLMYLNTLAGRSYNDLSQYPVFPWILADYESEHLDLTNYKTFRDLSKPMGAQTPDRLSQFLKRYREWDDPTGDTPPYMYGTHYSSAMIVLSYLVRQEPFTQQFLKLQGGHFDLADRMFHCVRDAWLSASRNNMADVKELIPEFFYLPELFLNTNNFDLGVKQSGVMLNDILLPPWSKGDPHEFVRIHRQALECDYVSEHLHEWIDLIFGYKQNGDAAKDASNIFHHLFYEENVDFESIDDPLTRNATLGFINNFGQIPAQLFKKPHPMRKIQIANALSFVPGVTTPRLFYHSLESLRCGKKPVKELKAAVGEIRINEKGQVVVQEQNKVFIPPHYFLAWDYYDRSIRFGVIGAEKSICILETNDVYEVTCMASADGKSIFAGLTTGSIMVWTLNGLNGVSSGLSPKLTRLTPKRVLDGHTDVVTALAACPTHNLIVSASRDKTAIVWHLTKLIYIRQLKGHSGAVSAVAVNEATGDIATASGSCIFLWTINGSLLSVVNTIDSGLFSNPSSLVLCLSFSTVNEWDSKNVVMCGTSDGLVKMYSCEFKKVVATNESEQTAAASKKSLGQNNQIQDPKALKEHLLRRQQRIQHHTRRSPLEQISQDSSQASSPVHIPNSITTTTTIQPSMSNDNKNEIVEYRRQLTLRRVLSEHTAFNQDNPHPAPVTSLSPSKDHKSVYVGDGVGRIWVWSNDQSTNSTTNSSSASTNAAMGKEKNAVDAAQRQFCLHCNRKFSMTENKISCKNCGQFFCQNCIDKTLDIRYASSSATKLQICPECCESLRQRRTVE